MKRRSNFVTRKTLSGRQASIKEEDSTHEEVATIPFRTVPNQRHYNLGLLMEETFPNELLALPAPQQDMVLLFAIMVPGRHASLRLEEMVLAIDPFELGNDWRSISCQN